MTAAEEGILLLCCRLGDPSCKPLTTAQFRDLRTRVQASVLTADPLRELTQQDLIGLGCPAEQAQHILSLLERPVQLHAYLSRGEQRKIIPITRSSTVYPRRLAQLQPRTCPPVLFAMGDISLLEQPSVAVVGSRHLLPENEDFAKKAGYLAAQEDLVLISGGAIGADRTAQTACLNAGGSCIIFTADRLDTHTPQDRVLYLSADGYDVPFSPARALYRNTLIHGQGDRTIAVQCTYNSGGTWQGCLENLKHSWSPLFVYDDGSPAMTALMEQGAAGVHTLEGIGCLQSSQISLF